MFSYCFMCNSNGDRLACVAEGGQACHTNYKAASVGRGMHILSWLLCSMLPWHAHSGTPHCHTAAAAAQHPCDSCQRLQPNCNPIGRHG